MPSPIDASWYIRPEGMPQETTAGGVVARIEEGRVLVAVVDEGKSGMFVLPKGHVEPGESLEEAAFREIEEEAGLSDIRLLGELDSKERLDFMKTEWKITHYFLFCTEQVHGQATDEYREYKTHWVDLASFPDLFWPEQTEMVRENADRIEREVRACINS